MMHHNDYFMPGKRPRRESTSSTPRGYYEVPPAFTFLPLGRSPHHLQMGGGLIPGPPMTPLGPDQDYHEPMTLPPLRTHLEPIEPPPHEYAPYPLPSLMMMGGGMTNRNSFHEPDAVFMTRSSFQGQMTPQPMHGQRNEMRRGEHNLRQQSWTLKERMEWSMRTFIEEDDDDDDPVFSILRKRVLNLAAVNSRLQKAALLIGSMADASYDVPPVAAKAKKAKKKMKAMAKTKTKSLKKAKKVPKAKAVVRAIVQRPRRLVADV